MADQTVDPQPVFVSSRPIVYVRCRTGFDPDEIGKAMGDGFAKLGAYLAEIGHQPSGPPMAIYTAYDDTGMGFNVALPVAPPALARATGDIMPGASPSGRALKVVHRGPYSGLRATYDAMRTHFREKGLPQNGPAWEVYVSDPERTAEKDLVTEIYMKTE